MIRVWMISYRWPPVYGGAGRQAHAVAVRLAPRDVEVTALTARLDKGLGARDTIDGIPVRRLWVGPWRGLRPVVFFLSAALSLAVHSKRIDVIHVLGAYLRVVPVVAAAKILRKKTVIKMTLFGEDDPASTGGRRFGGLVRWSLRRADAVVSLGGEMSASYRQSGLPESKLVEIPNGVSPEIFRPASPDDRSVSRHRLGITEETEVVTFVGPMNRRKGVDTLLIAWPQVIERRAHALLLLVGPFDEGALAAFPTLESLTSDTMRIQALGERKDVPRILQASDVFVLPTRSEGLPNSLLEAMASGVACVAGRIPGTEEVTDGGRCAVLVEPGDPAAIAESIVRFLEDPQKRRSMGGVARTRIIDKYSIDAVADAYAALYARLFGGRERSKADG
jgi:glycosyltransferase involved in cell wall biosynthesis